MAFEDCIKFSESLFRLSKSIVVSEPVISFKDLLRQRPGFDASALSPGRATV